ncbi:hypothetical protein P8605_04790 [Streptomyces sp. T-3]|nr:hypothetical protein [Streptomyces sp. T-3]
MTLLHAVANCAARGGDWLLTFEDSDDGLEASWVAEELGTLDRFDEAQDDEEAEEGELVGDAAGVRRVGQIFDAREESEKW